MKMSALRSFLFVLAAGYYLTHAVWAGDALPTEPIEIGATPQFVNFFYGVTCIRSARPGHRKRMTRRGTDCRGVPNPTIAIR